MNIKIKIVIGVVLIIFIVIGVVLFYDLKDGQSKFMKIIGNIKIENSDVINDEISDNVPIESNNSPDIKKGDLLYKNLIKNDDLKIEVKSNNDQGLIQKCPEAWYDNRMPTIVDNPTQKQPIRQYLIIGGDRYELSEVDMGWVAKNCSITKPMPVY